MWAASTLTTQADNDRTLLLQGATQTARAFSDRLLDLQEQTGQDLGNPELQAGVQIRAEDLIRSGTLPVTDVAVTDAQGRIVVAFERELSAGAAAAEEGTVRAWHSRNPGLATQLEALAQQALKTEAPITRTLNSQGLAVTATPLQGAAGVTLLALDDDAIGQSVRANLLRSLALLAVVLLAATLAASLVASRLIRRVQDLTTAAEAVSEGDLDRHIPITGADEITTLGEAVDRLAESSRIALQNL